MSGFEQTAGSRLTAPPCSHSLSSGGGGFIVDGRNQGNPLHDRPYYLRSPRPSREEAESRRQQLVRWMGVKDPLQSALTERFADTHQHQLVCHGTGSRSCPSAQIAEGTETLEDKRDGVGRSSSFIIANAIGMARRGQLPI